MKARVLLCAVMALILFSSAIFAACGGAPAPTPAPAPSAAPTPAATPTTPAPSVKPVLMRYSTALTASSYQGEMMKWEAAEIDKRTGGKVKVEVYADGQLYSHAAFVDAVILGAVDMGITAPGFLEGRNPIFGFYNLPFLIRNWDQWQKAQEDVRAILVATSDKIGVKFVQYVHNGEGAMASRVPINKMEDWKGLRINGPTAALGEAIKAAGAVPVQVAAAEMYDTMAKGGVEGYMLGWYGMKERRTYEVAKYYVGPLWATLYGTWVNKNKWDSLPKDIQPTLTQVFAEGEKRSWTAMLAADKDAKELLATKGTLKVLTPKEIDEWVVTFLPLYKSFVDKCAKAGSGAEAQKIIDVLEKAK